MPPQGNSTYSPPAIPGQHVAPRQWLGQCLRRELGALKRELVSPRYYTIRDEATQDLFKYIEVFYNQSHHSTIDYSPAEFERRTTVA